MKHYFGPLEYAASDYHESAVAYQTNPNNLGALRALTADGRRLIDAAARAARRRRSDAGRARLNWFLEWAMSPLKGAENG